MQAESFPWDLGTGGPWAAGHDHMQAWLPLTELSSSCHVISREMNL